MSRAETFEDLRIWQEARQLVREVYSCFHPGEQGYRDYGFRDQLRGAALSVMNNMAEGFERGSDQDFARFLDMAKASCGEVRSMFHAAEDLDYLSSDRAERARSGARELSRGIAALRAHLRK
jgi:four helix bundle protein